MSSGQTNNAINRAKYNARLRYPHQDVAISARQILCEWVNPRESMPVSELSNRPGRVVTFGEGMIRLTPPRNERLDRTLSLDVTIGGAELNVAVTLACLGVPVTWVSALPDTGLARNIARSARANDVQTTDIIWTEESAGRTGAYFLEEATDPRPSSVLYDRANSAFARIPAGSFDWTSILAGASALHICGITPAVGPGPRAETLAAMKMAKSLEIPVFFDLNYRSKLWSEAEARECFQEIIEYVDVLFASKAGLETFYGIERETFEGSMALALETLKLKAIALTRKRGKRSRTLKLCSFALNGSGDLADGGWRSIEVVDRLGGGDAFAGGFIAGYLEDSENLLRGVQLGSSASALKHTMPGDFLCATRAEIEAGIDVSEGGVLQR
jgi:2-dehydro-3-deoxygluconokinase